LFGIRDIKIFGVENYFTKLFKNFTTSFSNLSIKISLLQSLPRIFIETTLIMSILLLSLNLQDLETSLKIIGVTFVAGIRFAPSVSKIINAYQNIKYNYPALDTIYNILKTNNNKNNKLTRFQKKKIYIKKI